MLSFFERMARSVSRRLLKQTQKNEPRKDPPKPQPSPEKNHPWRLCPIGESWVRTHPLTIPPGEKSPGYQTTRRGHCRRNRGSKEIYTADELLEIASVHFKGLATNPQVMPIPDSLNAPNGNKYDLSIAGWTKFWSEILKSEDVLTPDFVKALISTESDFEIPLDVQSKVGLARGLVQITEQTRKILQDPKGEIKDHLIEMTIEESREPEVNISAGVRWLYHKKKLAEHRLKRKATWEEAVAEYKGILPDLGRDKKSDDIMRKLRRRHKRLKDQG